MSLALLLLDDDAVDRESVRRLLRAAGLDAGCVEAGTPDEAMALLEQRPFDCLLLDFRLAGSDGLDVLRRVREAGIDCPVVALTGQADQGTAVAMMKAGAADYLVKSALTAEALERAIRHAMQVAGGERERRALLAREQAAREEAQAANRAKDEFLATLSHELRTPLNAILGWTRLATSGGSPATAARALETVHRNAVLLAKLIDDLLDISRIITGKLTLERQPVGFAMLVDQIVESHRPAAASANVDLEYVAPRIDVPVMGDAARLTQVVTNLLSNALKFTPPGGRVRVSLDTQGRRAQLTVADNGAGIDPQFLPHVFEQFRQGDPSTTRKQGGLGLGLAIVRRLVEMHGGTVAAESPGRGRGAAFRVTLPTAAVAAAIRGAGPTLPVPGADSLRGITVLVVDDDDDGRLLLKAVLEDCGAVVRTAASVQEAMASIADARPDVLLSDIAMPGEDGYALLRKIRASDRYRLLPAAAISAYVSSEVRTHALSEGFDAHLAKPVDPAHLVQMVVALARGGGPAAITPGPPR